jgi:hypothetical protein
MYHMEMRHLPEGKQLRENLKLYEMCVHDPGRMLQ